MPSEFSDSPSSFAGAQHAAGLDPAQLRGLDYSVAGQPRANPCQRALQSRRAHCSPRTRSVTGVAAAAVHLAHAQLVRLRVRLGAEDLRDHHSVNSGGGRGDALELEAGHGQARASSAGAQGSSTHSASQA